MFLSSCLLALLSTVFPDFSLAKAPTFLCCRRRRDGDASWFPCIYKQVMSSKESCLFFFLIRGVGGVAGVHVN